MNHHRHHHRHHRHHRRSEIPLVVLGSYVLGYLAGRAVAARWIHGSTDAHGVRRLTGGAAGVARSRTPAA